MAAKQKRFSGCGFSFSPFAVFVGAMLLLGCLPCSVQAYEIILGTKKAGTFSHFTGRKLCRTVNSHAADITCRVKPAEDEVYNLTNLAGGSLDIALVDSRLFHDALNRTGNFQFMDIGYQNLCALLPVYDLPVTLVVREDAKIETLQDVKGKRINSGPPGSLEHLAVDRVFKAKGWAKEDFILVEELSDASSQDTMAFCHGTIQALIRIGIHPDPTLKQLFRLCPARPVDMADKDIQEMVRADPAYFPLQIAAGTYASVDRRVRTFGTKVLLVVSRGLDDGTVQTILEAFDRNREGVKNSHPALSSFVVGAQGIDPEAIPLHPAAVTYFQEHERSW